MVADVVIVDSEGEVDFEAGMNSEALHAAATPSGTNLELENAMSAVLKVVSQPNTPRKNN